MKPWCIVAFSLSTALILRSESKPPLSAAALLDEAIHRPGDYSQICDAGTPINSYAPPIPAFGLSVSQTLFLSDDMKKRLKDRRDEIVKEIGARLEKLDWEHPPAMPKLAKKPLFPPAGPISPDEDPTQPTDQNPRALGPVMLTIITELDAVEVLPHLLKLEDDLHRLTTAANTNDKAFIPTVTLGGPAQWIGMMKDFEKIEDWDKAPPKLKRKQRLFEAKVFDREILGVMLEMLYRKHYEPVKTSAFGWLRAVTLKHLSTTDETLREIKRPEDLSKDNEKIGVAFDSDLGIPYWRWEHALVSYSDDARTDARALVEAFTKGTKPALPTGEELLQAALAKPGSYSQMCGSPPSPSFDSPVPAFGVLAPRHNSLGTSPRLSLQSRRGDVIPPLAAKLHSLDFIARAQEGEGADPAVLLSVARILHAMEVLPDLLRLEEQLHAALATAEKDNGAPLPAFKIDSPVSLKSAKYEEGVAKKLPKAEIQASAKDVTPRQEEIYNCRIVQREILGVIGGLLHSEQYPPMLSSKLEQAYDNGLREIAKRPELENIKGEGDVPYESRDWIAFDAKLNIPVYKYGSVVQVPYTGELRSEIRDLAQDFLAKVPKEKWKGADAMVVLP